MPAEVRSDAPFFASSEWREPDQLQYKLSRSGQSPSGPGWDAMRTENANTWADKQDADAARAAMEQEKQRQLDAQYKAALGRMKTPAAPSDPWGDVRSVKTPATGR